MQNLTNKLKSNLEGAKRIAVLGVGSELRADDNAGMLITQDLERSQAKINKVVDLKVFLGHTAPENLSGEIKKYAPSHVLIVDTADIGKKPGEVAIFTPEDSGGISFSTHKLPIKVLAQYLTQSIDCRIIIIGIQPKTLDFGKDVSKEVNASIKQISNEIKGVMMGMKK
jgi:hydrogenase 3 maturation protease